MCRTQESALSRSFPPAVYGADPGAVAEGRRYVSTCLRELRALPDLAEIAALLTSELLTNAVLHGSTPVRVQVLVIGDRVRVTVADASPTMPVKRAGSAAGGWGLHLLDRAAAAWGQHEQGTGKCVWFELTLRTEQPDLTP